MAFALDNRLCSKDGGGTADGASRGCHEGGVAVELKHAAEPQAEEDGARNDDGVDNDGRHADGCHDSGRRNDNAKGLPKRCCCAHLRKADERRGKLRTFGRWADIAHVIHDGRTLRHDAECF